MDMYKLKRKFDERGVGLKDISEVLGISELTLYRKLNNYETFTIGEAVKLKVFLGLTNLEAREIFFASNNRIYATNFHQ